MENKSAFEKSYFLNQCHRRKLLKHFDNGSVALQQPEEELAGSEPVLFSHERIYARKRIEFEEVDTYKITMILILSTLNLTYHITI